MKLSFFSLRNIAHITVSPSPQITMFDGNKIPETVVTKACFGGAHLITVRLYFLTSSQSLSPSF